MMNDLEIERGSDNPFRDVGLTDADVELVKADLAAAIIAAVRRRELSQRAAAKLVALDQADISRIHKADLDRFTVDRLIAVLNRLDQRVSVTVTDPGSKAA